VRIHFVSGDVAADLPEGVVRSRKTVGEELDAGLQCRDALGRLRVESVEFIRRILRARGPHECIGLRIRGIVEQNQIDLHARVTERLDRDALDSFFPEEPFAPAALPFEAVGCSARIKKRADADIQRRMLDPQRQRIVNHLHLQPFFAERLRSNEHRALRETHEHNEVEQPFLSARTFF